jgi:hypothetical protein
LRNIGTLDELEKRILAIEQAVYRGLGATDLTHMKDRLMPESLEKPVQLESVSREKLLEMSMTELSQQAHLRTISADRFMIREDVIHAILEGEPVEDRLQSIRNEIKHYIDEVQPSLKQVLRCSKECIKQCPVPRVVDCWAGNRAKIQET